VPASRSPSMRLAPLTCAVTLALAVSLPGCYRAPAPPDTASASAPTPAANDAALQTAVDAFMDGWFERNPVAAANAGKHEYDGKLPDWSAAGLAANIEWLKGQRQQFAGIDPATLDDTGRFRREYV